MINEALKRTILSEVISDVICDFIELKAGDKVLRYVSNTENVLIGTDVYVANSFDIASGDPAAPDSQISITLTDIDRELIEVVQSAANIEVSVFSAPISDTARFLEGPYLYTVGSADVKSASQEVTLTLARKSVLSFNASATTYNTRTFPGLF